ncbi:Cupin domain protein [Rubripirellula reticaptiva]|uniref:Cupin domain protein n=1 Tax=Rubripirellula reticaptiva TaxID=2528013 RepID=A0A5C6ELC4_9BACT|nr:Cupin domain protein [Rubripirellula reticaptiva]
MCLEAVDHFPHVHRREKKSFYVLEGKITFQIDAKRVVATAGTFAYMTVSTTHSSKNKSNQTAKMIISIAPAGLEEMFFEFGVPLPEGSTSALPPTKDETETLLAIAPKYGIEIRVPQHD